MGVETAWLAARRGQVNEGFTADDDHKRKTYRAMSTTRRVGTAPSPVDQQPELPLTVVPAGPRRQAVVATTPHLLVCIGPNCTARGSGEMFSKVWAALERDRLAYYKSPGTVRCSATGCLGACADGPTVASYPQQGAPQWWVGMNAEATIELAAELHAQAVLHAQAELHAQAVAGATSGKPPEQT